ncbi:hypothetical protein MTR67_041267, partial [Solanum verrucosum]
KESKASMLIGDMGITMLMVHVQQVEKDQLKDREEFKNKKANTSRNESGQQKSSVNQSSFQRKQKRPAPSSASAPHQGTNVSTIVRIPKISEQDLRIRKVVRIEAEYLKDPTKTEVTMVDAIVKASLANTPFSVSSGAGTSEMTLGTGAQTVTT